MQQIGLPTLLYLLCDLRAHALAGALIQWVPPLLHLAVSPAANPMDNTNNNSNILYIIVMMMVVIIIYPMITIIIINIYILYNNNNTNIL